MGDYQPLFNLIGGLASLGLGAWLTAMARTNERQANTNGALYEALNKERTERQRLETKIAETYMPKTDMQREFEKIDERFKLTDQKLDDQTKKLNDIHSLMLSIAGGKHG